VSTLISTARPKVVMTATLPAGTIRSRGTFSDFNQNLRVVGGTGAYAHARGTTTALGLEVDGDPALNVYRLRLP
jgi:hypothetical protein